MDNVTPERAYAAVLRVVVAESIADVEAGDPQRAARRLHAVAEALDEMNVTRGPA